MIREEFLTSKSHPAGATHFVNGLPGMQSGKKQRIFRVGMFTTSGSGSILDRRDDPSGSFISIAKEEVR